MWTKLKLHFFFIRMSFNRVYSLHVQLLNWKLKYFTFRARIHHCNFFSIRDNDVEWRKRSWKMIQLFLYSTDFMHKLSRNVYTVDRGKSLDTIIIKYMRNISIYIFCNSVCIKCSYSSLLQFIWMDLKFGLTFMRKLSVILHIGKYCLQGNRSFGFEKFEYSISTIDDFLNKLKEKTAILRPFNAFLL